MGIALKDSRPVRNPRFGCFRIQHLGNFSAAAKLFIKNRFLCNPTLGTNLGHRILVMRIQLVESKTRTYHGRVGSGRTAGRRGGGAGSGRTGRRQNISPRRQASLVPSKASKTRRLNVSPEARTSEFRCKPMEEHNDRLTSGLCPVYVRFITGTRSALRSWLLTSGPTPCCLCKPFSRKACPGIYSRTPLAQQRKSPGARSRVDQEEALATFPSFWSCVHPKRRLGLQSLAS